MVQAIDEGLILQNITLRIGEFFEQLLFVACQLDLESLLFLEQLCLPAFELWLLKVDGDGEELAFEATLRHREVDVRDEGLGVWRNVYELVSGGQVELERWVVINCLVSDLHHLARPLLIQVLPEDWKEEGLDAIDLLDDEDFSESDGQLQDSVELLVLVVEDLYALLALLQRLPEPGCGRSGRIYDQGSPDRVQDDDGIFHREPIGRKAFLFEGEQLGLSREEGPNVELLDFQGAAPLLEIRLSGALVLASEVSGVGTAEKGFQGHQRQLSL